MPYFRSCIFDNTQSTMHVFSLHLYRLHVIKCIENKCKMAWNEPFITYTKILLVLCMFLSVSPSYCVTEVFLAFSKATQRNVCSILCCNHLPEFIDCGFWWYVCKLVNIICVIFSEDVKEFYIYTYLFLFQPLRNGCFKNFCASLTISWHHVFRFS